MLDERDSIIASYSKEYQIEAYSYKIMGKLLEVEKIKERLDLFHITHLYIYGGGFLGVQLYRAVKENIDVLSIVDLNGNLSVDVSGIPVINLEKMKQTYTNESVIITPINYYKQIYEDLSKFVGIDKLFYLGEFVEGVV